MILNGFPCPISEGFSARGGAGRVVRVRRVVLGAAKCANRGGATVVAKLHGMLVDKVEQTTKAVWPFL